MMMACMCNVGARVAIACMGANGVMMAYKEESTNWMGGYAMRFEGSPDLSRCYARVTGGPSVCAAAAGPAQRLNLMFSMFGMQMYAVDPLLSQPQQPMPFCPRSSPPLPTPVTLPTPPLLPPPARVVPILPPPPPPPAGTPDVHPPPNPFTEASACSYEYVSAPPSFCVFFVKNLGLG